MNTEEIKAYVEERLERSNRLIPSERTASYYEEQLRLRELWLRADQAQALERIATCLDTQELQDIVTAQEKRIEQADSTNALLLRIALGIEALNPGR